MINTALSTALVLPAAAQRYSGAAVSVATDANAWRVAAGASESRAAWVEAMHAPAATNAWNTGSSAPLLRSGCPATESARLSVPETDSPLVEFAATLVGSRYRFGSSDGEFECSGLVKHVYAEFGLDLPHSSRQQFALGQRVARDALQPGDLVFFRGAHGGDISHVGIYAGDDLFVHAARHAGQVRLDSLSGDYFATRYAGARRLCAAAGVEC